MHVLTSIIVASWSALAYGASLEDRIVGGHETDIKDVPYQLSLLLHGFHECGASIISENWALTAAHCLTEYTQPSWVSLRAGSSTRGSGGTVHDVKTIIRHPQFNSTNYDYVLLEVKTPFDIGTPGIDKIGLADAEPKQGVECIVSGWGMLSSGGSLPWQLHSVEVPIVDRASCKNAYGEGKITDRMICAGYINEGGKDACQYDSGGPLVSNGKQVGIVSWGYGCADPKYPGVYANVAAERAWIKEHTGV